ncbi:MAG: PIN domain-containing protein [Deltaproteobacteria bacterium]|nr:PIN domain-containing protein [Deltaproteobacteria bacterium]
MHISFANLQQIASKIVDMGFHKKCLIERMPLLHLSHKPVISMLTLGELLYISFRLGQPDKGKELVDSIDKSARVMPVDRPIVEKAASLKAGRGIPYIDSIILSTFMLTGCREIHTTDRNHFSEIKNKGLSFVFY